MINGVNTYKQMGFKPTINVSPIAKIHLKESPQTTQQQTQTKGVAKPQPIKGRGKFVNIVI